MRPMREGGGEGGRPPVARGATHEAPTGGTLAGGGVCVYRAPPCGCGRSWRGGAGEGVEGGGGRWAGPPSAAGDPAASAVGGVPGRRPSGARQRHHGGRARGRAGNGAERESRGGSCSADRRSTYNKGRQRSEKKRPWEERNRPSTADPVAPSPSILGRHCQGRWRQYGRRSRGRWTCEHHPPAATRVVAARHSAPARIPLRAAAAAGRPTCGEGKKTAHDTVTLTPLQRRPLRKSREDERLWVGHARPPVWGELGVPSFTRRALAVAAAACGCRCASPPPLRVKHTAGQENFPARPWAFLGRGVLPVGEACTGPHPTGQGRLHTHRRQAPPPMQGGGGLS